MRHTSAGLYAVLILCFFFPWLQVSCGFLQVDVSGFQLAKGNFEGNFTSPEDIRVFRESLEDKNQGAQWWLFFVPMASAAGIVLHLVGFGRLVHALLSLGCVGIVLGEYAYLRNELGLAASMINFEPAHGFWLTVVIGGINALIVKTFARKAKHRLVEKQTVSIEFDPVSPPVKSPPRKSLREQAVDIRRSSRANRSG